MSKMTRDELFDERDQCGEELLKLGIDPNIIPPAELETIADLYNGRRNNSNPEAMKQFWAHCYLEFDYAAMHGETFSKR